MARRIWVITLVETAGTERRIYPSQGAQLDAASTFLAEMRERGFRVRKVSARHFTYESREGFYSGALKLTWEVAR